MHDIIKTEIIIGDITNNEGVTARNFEITINKALERLDIMPSNLIDIKINMTPIHTSENNFHDSITRVMATIIYKIHVESKE